MNKRSLYVRIFAFHTLALAVCIALYGAVFPQLEQATYSIDGAPPVEFTFPFRENAGRNTRVLVAFNLRTATVYPSHYGIVADDCLLRATINSYTVYQANIDTCIEGGRVLSMGPYLKTGLNSIEMEVWNKGGPSVLHVDVHALDPLLYLLRVAMFALVFHLLFVLVRNAYIRNLPMPMLLLGAICSAWFLLYDVHMLYSQYAYDWSGHSMYIDYILQHWSIPPAHLGWETYQPPLYYVLAAVWQTTWPIPLWSVQHIEWFSTILMTIALAMSVWVFRMLFSNHVRFWSVVHATVLLCVIPGVVFFSNRISNDVLFFLLSIATLGSLLQWCKQRKAIRWYGTIVLLALALLAKSNALALVPVVFGTLLLQSQYPWSKKCTRMLEGIIMLSILTGWYYVFRFFVENQQNIVGNIHILNKKLLVPNTWENYLTFHPQEMLNVPFNNPWKEGFRREIFWESFYKSIFFGEFRFPDVMNRLAALILFLSFTYIPALLFGIWTDIRTRLKQCIPLLLTLVFFMAELLAFRVSAPYSSNQDFRFIAPIIIPVLYFVVRGIETYPPWLRYSMYIVSSTFVILCMVFVARVVLKI